jgi:hypothetical protein
MTAADLEEIIMLAAQAGTAIAQVVEAAEQHALDS